MYPGVSPAGSGSPCTVGTAMLTAVGRALAGAGFLVASPVPAAGLVDDEVAEAADCRSCGHSSAVSPPATARTTSRPATSSQRCRRRSAAGSGPGSGGSGPPGPDGEEGGGWAELSLPSAGSSPTATGGTGSRGNGTTGGDGVAGGGP